MNHRSKMGYFGCGYHAYGDSGQIYRQPAVGRLTGCRV